MQIFYASRTGNVKRFIDKIDMNAKAINDVDVVNEPFIVVTYTDKLGDVPKAVSEFLEKHHEYLVGVSASGRRAWGLGLFAASADKISQKYGVPIISKFEMQGIKGDVEIFREGVLNLCQNGLSLTMR